MNPDELSKVCFLGLGQNVAIPYWWWIVKGHPTGTWGLHSCSLSQGLCLPWGSLTLSWSHGFLNVFHCTTTTIEEVFMGFPTVLLPAYIKPDVSFILDSEGSSLCEVVHLRSESEGRPERTFHICCRLDEVQNAMHT